VKYGVTFARLRPALWPETAELCDALGYESVWLPEHLVLPVQQSGSPYAGSEHPPVRADAPVYDVFTMLAFFAGRTERIRLGTNVYNIGLRHPFVTARRSDTGCRLRRPGRARHRRKLARRGMGGHRSRLRQSRWPGR
jgi:alkanesulfonate monooxygenase SsuD/methylene tetrahydromethanopterin reductase-like flavin-dependent oxidoreductase (luciferase family)